MTYYADLTPYEYYMSSNEGNILNVGWLEKGNDFPKGSVDDEVTERIFELCKSPVRRMRGYQECMLCSDPPYPIVEVRNNEEIILGSAEIRVRGKNGFIYASPNMIYHYIVKHSYLPPDEFINSLLGLSEI